MNSKFSIKSFLNFKENKSYKITIVLLVMICLVFQTSTSFSNEKVEAANLKIASLNKKIKVLEKSTTTISSIDDLIDKEVITKDDSYKISIEAILERYSAIGKENNKEYDKSIKEEKRILAFETLDLNSMTDNQIKAGITELTKDTFGIEIQTKDFEGNIFYKIILIE